MCAMTRAARRVRRALVWTIAIVVMALAAGGFYARREMRRSLPILDGTVSLAGLSADVTVERDRLGVPTITASSRADAARALGFLHAQDRFFQMDLQRRQAAGELSALVGARAIAADRLSRLHRFRHISRAALTHTTPAYRAILEAYAAGVNDGLGALGAPPPEYLLLRQTPAPWTPEDSLLTILAMFNTLQGRQAQFEATFGTLADTVPPALYDFLSARGSEWDAPVTGGRLPRPSTPGADVLDLRKDRATEAQRHRDYEGKPDLSERRLAAYRGD